VHPVLSDLLLGCWSSAPLLDPLDSWIAQWVFHEYNEVYLYWSMLSNETDERIKALWEGTSRSSRT
jgi:hypothetical protein